MAVRRPIIAGNHRGMLSWFGELLAPMPMSCCLQLWPTTVLRRTRSKEGIGSDLPLSQLF